MGDNHMEENRYMSPVAVVLEINSEGVLCSSSNTESIEENDGIW